MIRERRLGYQMICPAAVAAAAVAADPPSVPVGYLTLVRYLLPVITCEAIKKRAGRPEKYVPVSPQSGP